MSDPAVAPSGGESVSALTLGRRDVHVWVVPLDAPNKQARRAQAALALRHLLAAYLGTDPEALAFERGEFGKPRLARDAAVLGDGAIAFNLSHSGALALLAVARELEVGVDVQEPHRATDSAWFAQRICTPRERAALGDAPAAPELLRLWVRKEAVIKARGDLSYVSAAAVDVSEDRVAGGWRCIDLNLPEAPEARAALAFSDRAGVTVTLRGTWAAQRRPDPPQDSNLGASSAG